ncbi:MAG: protein kinase [Victivallales bacterium]
MQELSRDYIINGKYRIVEKRGKGAMGTAVYLGTDLEHSCDVIIRVLPQSLFGDEEMSARFMQGINLAKKLHHPNILSVLDAGVEKDIEYVITNYEKGYFLNDYLEHRGVLDENEGIMLVKSLSEALDYAWNEQQIIHRNVSPETILVAKHNVPMLTDFDLAKSLMADGKLTCAGYTIGEPTYMSPEQAKGEEVDFRSDIYCLGLVFYQLLAGKPPFHSKSRMEILCSQVSDRHAPIQTQNKRITDACSNVLDKMLAKDMKDRYQSWKALIDDLEAILNQKTPATPQKAVSQPPANYKMQAIQMPAAKTTVAFKTEGCVPPKRETGSAFDSSDIPAHGSSSKRNAIIIVLVLSIVIVGVFVKLRHNKPNNERVEPKDQQALKSETGILPSLNSKTETIPSVEPKIKSAANPETKPVVPIESGILPPEKPKSGTSREAATVAGNIDKAKEEKHRKACMNNIKQIGVALQMYANVFEGKFPEAGGAKGLNQLRTGGFLEHPQSYVCPATGNMPAVHGQPITEECCDYAYVGGLSEHSDGNTPILWCKPDNHKDYGNILYVNGEIKAVSGNNWLSQTKPPKK